MYTFTFFFFFNGQGFKDWNSCLFLLCKTRETIPISLIYVKYLGFLAMLGYRFLIVLEHNDLMSLSCIMYKQSEKNGKHHKEYSKTTKDIVKLENIVSIKTNTHYH